MRSDIETSISAAITANATAILTTLVSSWVSAIPQREQYEVIKRGIGNYNLESSSKKDS